MHYHQRPVSLSQRGLINSIASKEEEGNWPPNGRWKCLDHIESKIFSDYCTEKDATADRQLQSRSLSLAQEVDAV